MIEPMVYAVMVIALIFMWVAYEVWKMKKSFEERGGSYAPLIPEWLKGLK